MQNTRSICQLTSGRIVLWNSRQVITVIAHSQHNLILVLVAILCLGCNQADDTPSSPVAQEIVPQDTPAAPGTIAITFTGDEIQLHGKRLPWPFTRQQLIEAIGKPDRIVDRTNINVISVWDAAGILAYCKPGKDQVNSLAVEYVAEGFDFSPKQLFKGRIQLPTGSITPDATQKSLQDAGLIQDPEIPLMFVMETPQCTIIAEYIDSLQGVSFGVTD